MAKKKEKKRKNNKKFYKILSFILLLVTVFAFSVLTYFDALPMKYLIIGGALLALIILFIMYKLNVKTNLFTKSIIFIFIGILGSIYAFGTINFFNNIFDTGYKIESYGVYTLSTNEYKKIKELNNKNIAIKNDDDSSALEQALNKLSKRIKYEKQEFDNISDTINSVVTGDNDAFIVNESIMNIYVDEHDEMPNLRLIDTIEVTIKDESKFKDVNVTKKPFVVYISGIDDTGNILKSARSDVNILAFVNPNTGKVLFLSLLEY